MFDCPQCGKETRQLVIPQDGKLSGRCCANVGPKRVNVNLGQTVQKWTHIDKKTGNEIKHKLTSGKEWEITNRKFAEDGKTVINRVTNKEAQY